MQDAEIARRLERELRAADILAVQADIAAGTQQPPVAQPAGCQKCECCVTYAAAHGLQPCWTCGHTRYNTGGAR